MMTSMHKPETCEVAGTDAAMSTTQMASASARRDQILREAMTARDLLIPSALTAMLNTPDVGPLGTKCYVDSFLRDAGSPSDPIEIMLLQQMLMAHHRVSQLHLRAERTQSPEHLKILNAAAARLLGEVRRLALAIKVYR